MTARRSFKQLVRARMAKTGESYTAARAQLLSAADRGRAQAEVPRLACSDEKIRERTGRGWEEWFELLDSWDATALDHTSIARRVAEVQSRPPLAWNVQAVVSSYELTRGLREVGQRVGREGWVAGASRTISASQEEALMAVVDPVRRAAWLPDVDLSERAVNKPKTARFDVAGGATRLLVTATKRPDGRTAISVEESHLPSAQARESRKKHWQQALTRLKQALEENNAKKGPRDPAGGR